MHLNNRKSGNEYAVIKYRNDILKLFNIFTTLRFQSDGRSCLIPTNTLTLDWKFKEKGLDILENGEVWEQTDKVVKSTEITKGEIINETEREALPSDSIVYWNPFIVVYDKKYNLIRLYEPDINERFDTDYYLLNSKIPYTGIS